MTSLNYIFPTETWWKCTLLQVVYTKEVLSLRANRCPLTQHLQTSFSIKVHSMAVARVNHICRIFLSPSLQQQHWRVRNAQEFRWTLKCSVLVCWHCNYFCISSQCLLWFGCYLCISETFFVQAGVSGTTSTGSSSAKDSVPSLYSSGPRAFLNLWESETTATKVTKSLAGKEQEE